MSFDVGKRAFPFPLDSSNPAHSGAVRLRVAKPHPVRRIIYSKRMFSLNLKEKEFAQTGKLISKSRIEIQKTAHK